MSERHATDRDEAARARVDAQQYLRMRRQLMAMASYLVIFAVVVLCWYQGMVPAKVVLFFALFSVLINGALVLTIRSGFNLRFADPSLTAAQMVASFLPAAYVMFHLESGQARAVFLLIALVPGLYGILALNIRRFMTVCLLFFLIYLVLLVSLWQLKPQVLSWRNELLQTVAFALVLAELAIIGGFISGLRGKLRQRNHQLNDALERISEMANRDALTGVFNRRHLFEVLARETNRNQRTNGTFSICIMDVDHFKEVNDQYGHQMGDEVLKRIAESVASSLRNIDCFGRYGGEEFLLILPQTPLDGARIKAERVRKAIAELAVASNGDRVGVSVSIGVAVFQGAESIDDTIHRADRALYQAKENGRDQVATEDDLPGDVSVRP
jgi:diguanylate cyclase (GGDEF)-like protein